MNNSPKRKANICELSHIVATCALILALSGISANAETVNVKYRGPVNIDAFDCPALKPSSVVNRICYHEPTRYLIVQLRSTYYHYCEVGQNVVAAWVAAPSLGQFYNANIKVSSNGGLYDCRGKELTQF